MNHLNRTALTAGSAAALIVVAAIVTGSRGLEHFDPALIWYALGSVLAAFAAAFRFTVWAQRPPTRLYFKRGLQLLVTRGPTAFSGEAPDPARFDGSTGPRYSSSRTASAPMTLPLSLADGFVAQHFIRRRSVYRWIMHICLSGGCSLAFAITFPLVFGWVHFESFATDAEMYRVRVLGFNAGAFSVHSVRGWLMFNLLNLSALLVLIGLVMAFGRRLVDAGERAVQTFLEDILPLILISAVTVTGLMLTASYKLMAGRGHSTLATAHAAGVIALLFYLPFGKLFHLFQRTCGLCVKLYQGAGAAGPRARCLGCGADYASKMQVNDLKQVLDELGFNYRFATPLGERHYQDICPACRRRLLAVNQGRSVGR
jgi:nitrate reductase gamma subunit